MLRFLPINYSLPKFFYVQYDGCLLSFGSSFFPLILKMVLLKFLVVLYLDKILRTIYYLNLLLTTSSITQHTGHSFQKE